MRRFLCTEIPAPGADLTLDAPTSHHLLRVTGIAPGESVELFDGMGTAARATLERVEAGRAVLRVGAEVSGPEAARPVWLLPALLRPAAMETVIRMATELGVVRISPLRTERVVARGDRSERWLRIAAAAAAQCGRADLPQLDPPVHLPEALKALPADWTVQICVPGAERAPEGQGAIALFVGPEGGFSTEETEAVLAAGATAVGLGATTLRADTAVAAALARALGCV